MVSTVIYIIIYIIIYIRISIYIILILEEIIFISKGQVRCIQTLTVQIEGLSLETSKFSLYFSGSCIPIQPKLSYIFPQNFSLFPIRFQCKMYQILDAKL